MNSFSGALSDELEGLGRIVVDSAFAVHSKLGPGLLESLYEACMVYELTKRGCEVKRQLPVAVHYEEILIEGGLRLDLLVNDSIIIEIKSVDQLHDIHKAQLLTYLKLTNKPLGYLINFNVTLIKDGLKRYINK